MATNAETGKKSLPVSIDTLKRKILREGYTVQQLRKCITKYQTKNTWEILSLGTILIFNKKNCKTNNKKKMN